MIGEKWRGIPNFEQRETCTICNRTESMQHILLECKSNTRKLIWRKARALWPHGRQHWPQITLGTIIGIGCISLADTEVRQEAEKTRSMEIRGRTRLLQILISEASHLVWVMRCERVIHGKNHTSREITRRWTKKINERLTNDQIITTKIKRDPKLINLTNATWKKTLINANIPHRNWQQHREVFSG